jgi:Domain of unknown function (DUF4864)
MRKRCARSLVCVRAGPIMARLVWIAVWFALAIAGSDVTRAQPWQPRDEAPPPDLPAATGLTLSDRVAMRRLIETQIAAMRSGDWPSAFALASPDLQVKYGTPTALSYDVAAHYAPLPYVAGVDFMDIVTFRDLPTYRVILTDGAGSTTTAYYLVRRLDDGSLRIAGCVLVRTPNS